MNELILPLRAPEVMRSDAALNLIHQCQLVNLTKLLLVLPGLNDMPGAFNLSLDFLRWLLDYCKNLNKVGNVFVWDVSLLEVMNLIRNEYNRGSASVNDSRAELEIQFKIMHMR